tara:strand:+ start:508 stop:1788 length:1281 start_codon:yes stop_codon:yes gene_type:complete
MIIVPGYIAAGDITGVTAGDGLSGGGASGGVTVTLDLNELTAASVADGDFIPIIDTNDSNASRKEAVADLATLFAGDGLTASSSVLAVNVDDSTIETSSDAIRVKDNGISLAKMAGLTRGSMIIGNASGDPAELTKGSANYVLTSDGTDIAWAAAATGDITGVTAGDGLSGGGSSGGVTLALDLNELTGATLADGDSLVFIDANDSNGSRKEAFADVLDTIAGTVATTGLDRSGATLVLSDLHPVGVSGSNNQLITDDGDGTVTSESNLTFNGSVLTVTGSVDTTLDQHFDSSPSDETVSGITATFTAGEDLVRGEVVYFKAGDSKMWKAVATAAGTMPVAAMAAADISADATGKFLLYGFLADNGTFPAYTVGGDLYAPEAETSSQNVPEQTAPDSDGDFVQVLGYAVTANSVFFDPDQTVVEVA